ncbi:MAG TPA: TylF/MycF/NovP-related O-methyltransferase [Alphaproteobacteria bacterium]|jgi:O-methyltransferase|nr:TylF/MycF/NovP-related O-methyltransferase [Alphaproteobacteria bacterium]
MSSNPPDDIDLQSMMVSQHIRAVISDFEPDFLPFYRAIRAYSGGSPERLYNLHQGIRYIVSAGIPGAFVECGVWKGGTMMMVASTLVALGATDRKLYLYDTYEGHPKPDEKLDVDLHGHRAVDDWFPQWMEVSEDAVRDNMARTGYPMENVVLVKGRVEDTLPQHAPDTVALLRLDVDWHSPCRHALEHLFPRLSPDGLLILDDYGHYQGFRTAVDEYLESARSPMLLNRIDYACRVGVKTGRTASSSLRTPLTFQCPPALSARGDETGEDREPLERAATAPFWGDLLQEIEHLRGDLAAREEQHSAERTAAENLRAETARLKDALMAAEQALTAAEQRSVRDQEMQKQLRLEMTRMHMELSAVYESLSWRMTAPLRRLKNRLSGHSN